ncbi:HD domain-containing protein [Vulcanisaeta souniana]|uniref:HD domain-containing protein n=1 Tax=Vulcanisaeta souniana TaxID=164452 RepID=UPI0006D13D28|nr:HD domain-containing protein [Vulcanisaeta souniana]
MGSSITNAITIVDILMNIPRVGWIQRGVPRTTAESVGEHTLLVSYLTLLICNEVRRVDRSIDASKCISMSIIHDAHEALIGNVGNNARSLINEWKDLETRLFSELGLPEELNNYFREYRYALSIEGKIVNFTDKLATYMRACTYAKNGYDTRELINSYRELMERLLNEFPDGVKQVIQGVNGISVFMV